MDLINEKELYELVNKISVTYFQKPFIDDVRFNHRLRTTGGRYIPVKRLIELNPKYAMEMGQNEFIGIIKHELCHYHLHIEGKGYRHRDKDFRELLKRTGSPRFCSPLPSEEKNYKHVYRCKKCDQVYERKRRINIQKYRCGKCKGALKYVSID
ncbi:SprT family protein [Oceanobacillus sp. FSL K6-2867]|uniref:SprT family protein n=1 Tax=Oceanobacillus sp. FSL K6-2867 TaxID=2954748 RepID=UPI0030D73873